MKRVNHRYNLEWDKTTNVSVHSGMKALSEIVTSRARVCLVSISGFKGPESKPVPHATLEEIGYAF